MIESGIANINLVPLRKITTNIFNAIDIITFHTLNAYCFKRVANFVKKSNRNQFIILNSYVFKFSHQMLNLQHLPNQVQYRIGQSSPYPQHQAKEYNF